MEKIETKQITELLEKWQSEDEKNRGFVIVLTTRTEKTEEQESFETLCGVSGKDHILTVAMGKVLREENSPLRSIINRVMRRINLAKFIDTIANI